MPNLVLATFISRYLNDGERDAHSFSLCWATVWHCCRATVGKQFLLSSIFFLFYGLLHPCST